MQVLVRHRPLQLFGAVPLPLIEANAPGLLSLLSPPQPLCLAQFQSGIWQQPMLPFRMFVASTDAAEFLLAAFPKTSNARRRRPSKHALARMLDERFPRNSCHEVRRSGLGDRAYLCLAGRHTSRYYYFSTCSRLGALAMAADLSLCR